MKIAPREALLQRMECGGDLLERVLTRERISLISTNREITPIAIDSWDDKTPTVDLCSASQRKGTNRLRIGRCSLPNQIYHVTASTLERVPFFVDYQSARSVVDAFRREEAVEHAKTMAFVVMPDHFHWLLTLGDSCTLSTTVSNVKSISARTVNSLLGCSGAVWQSGFHDRAIRRDEDIAAVARYIVANPLRAGLVRKIGDYPYWDAIWL